MKKVHATERTEVPIDERGYFVLKFQVWVENVSSFVNNLVDQIEAILGRLDELEPNYISITAADSPFQASNNDYIKADMSTGDIIVIPPSAGRWSLSRLGSVNTLTIQGVVNGITNPNIVGAGDAPSMAFIDEWRYV